MTPAGGQRMLEEKIVLKGITVFGYYGVSSVEREVGQKLKIDVEFWSDFVLLKPVDPLRGNRRILYDVNNRGDKLALSTFNGAAGNNPSTLADAGNEFLMHQGYSVLWCGWCGDVTADGTVLPGSAQEE